MNKKPVQTIAITAAKGGVGKTNVSINLAISLAKQGQKVVVFDADLGLANVDILLGLHSRRNLYHVIKGECDLKDILVEGPAGIKIIPAASGIEYMTRLNPLENAGIINAFSELSEEVDVMIIDTAAGISDSVMSFCRASQEVIVVVCNEPASITDAYALIKVLSRDYQVQRFRVISNMVANQREGRELYMKLCRVTDEFLDVILDYIGAIPYDELLRKAVKQQAAVCEAYPNSKSALAFKTVVSKVTSWVVPQEITGNATFFIDRLVASGLNQPFVPAEGY